MIGSNLKKPLPPKTEHGRRATAAEGPHATPPTYGILVVDDEDSVRRVLNSVMRQQGFAVWLAANGQEALDLYRRHHQTIDVVLMDVCMPRLDGPHTLAALQGLNARIRCCFMSGDLGSYSEERLCDLGAAAVIAKPFRLDEVAQMLWDLARHADLRPCIRRGGPEFAGGFLPPLAATAGPEKQCSQACNVRPGYEL